MRIQLRSTYYFDKNCLELTPEELMEVDKSIEKYFSITILDAPTVGDGLKLLDAWFSKTQQWPYKLLLERIYIKHQWGKDIKIAINCMMPIEGSHELSKLFIDVDQETEYRKSKELGFEKLGPRTRASSLSGSVELTIDDVKLIDRMLGTLDDGIHDEVIAIDYVMNPEYLIAYFRMVGWGRFWVKYEDWDPVYDPKGHTRTTRYLHA